MIISWLPTHTPLQVAFPRSFGKGPAGTVPLFLTPLLTDAAAAGRCRGPFYVGPRVQGVVIQAGGWL